MEDDPIKKLLQQTGWSYAEVLKKLEAYKDQFPSESEPKTCDKETTSENSDKQLSASNNDSVDLNNIEEKSINQQTSTNADENRENTASDNNSSFKLSDSEGCETATNIDEFKNENNQSGSDIIVSNKVNSEEESKNSTEDCTNEENNDDDLEEIIRRLEKVIEDNELLDNEEFINNKAENRHSLNTTDKVAQGEEQIKDVKERHESINNNDKDDTLVNLTQISTLTEIQEHISNPENKLDDDVEKLDQITEKGECVQNCENNIKLQNELQITKEHISNLENKLDDDVEKLDQITEKGECVQNCENNIKLQNELQITKEDSKESNKTVHNVEEYPSNSESLNLNTPKDQGNQNVSNSAVAKETIGSTSTEVISNNLKRNLSNIRLRIIRKSKNTLSRKLKKRGENNFSASPTEDIRSKIKEQLELLRTKRKTGESPLIGTPPKPSCSRLKNITNVVRRKLSTAEKVIPQPFNGIKSSSLITNSSNKYSIENKKLNSPHLKDNSVSDESVVLSDETDLMIVNVVGGYKSPTPERYNDDIDVTNEKNGSSQKTEMSKENKDCEEANNDNKELVLDGIMPTKTKDVTKIKGWKNKKFAIENRKDRRKPSDILMHHLMNDIPEPTTQHENSSPLKIVDDTSPAKPLMLEQPKNSDQAKSAFVSDELDQYLTENAELKISYEVPKLEAEQTITTKYIDIRFPELPSQTARSFYTNNKDRHKPKTLAEKRKMLAEANNPEVTDFLIGMNNQQRKDYEKGVLSMRKKLLEEDTPFTRRCFMTSTTITNTHNFVLYNGKKLKVASTGSNEIVAKVKEKRKIYKSLPPTPLLKKGLRQRKPSLLNDLKTEDVKKCVFKPTEWKTVRVKLPNIVLELKPQLGKRIHPKIEHLIKSDDVILAENRVEFALSALKVSKPASIGKTFVFPLSYNNNEKYVTLRKRHLTAVVSPEKIEKPVESETEISKSVSDVMNRMLDYVEISEETKDIVQIEDNPENSPKIDLPTEEAKVPDNTNWRRRKRRKFYGEKGVHRTTLEMRRLNCKIVSLSLDEDHNENNACTKEFCKLGCVCKSIACSSTNLLVSHCGLSRCMFECKCKCKNLGVNENFSLPAGSNIFSEGIINRLQDEAKKNLAKVEKEFTQTVIKTNKQIIVVGDSKDRRRRATKMPKKYIDFVEEDPTDKLTSSYEDAESKYRSLAERPTLERLSPESSSTEYEEIIPESFPVDANIINTNQLENVVKECYVKVFKHDFSKLLPFCLVHSLYKCHCKNKAVFDGNVKDKSIVACTYVNSPKLEQPVRNRLKTTSGRTFDKELYSSRTRGLATSYYLIRNKSLSYKTKIRKYSRKLRKDLETFLLDNANEIIQVSTEPEELSKLSETVKEENPVVTSRSRKQSFVVLEDPGDDASSEATDLLQHLASETERKLQRRRTKSISKVTGQDLANVTKIIGESPTTLFGDANKFNSEFHALFGLKNSQLRFLPWKTLASGFENELFQIWYSDQSKSSPLAITDNAKPPTPQHCNIKQFGEVKHEEAMPSNIIRWLITKKVPLEKSVENILIVLYFNKKYWEICGLCEKNKPNLKTDDNVSLSLIHNWKESDNNGNLSPNTKSSSSEIEDCGSGIFSLKNDSINPIHTEKITKENLQEHKKVMYCSKRRYQPKKMISDEMDDDSLKVRQVLWAPIPSITLACKWRVIFMNVGFAYLSLSRSSYTIKFDDIMKAIKMAHQDKTTIVLKAEEIQKNYHHKNFGIYCVHNYMDKIFVGPYYLNESHDLDTVRYVNGMLVNTSIFNQGKGKNDPGNGHWFHQAVNEDDKNVDDDIVIVQEPTPVVDLTCDSDEESVDDSMESKPDTSIVPHASFKNCSTLLKSMLLRPILGRDYETSMAEKTLDTLLKKGELNVNKTLVNVSNSKILNKIKKPVQNNLDTSTVVTKTSAIPIQMQNIDNVSEFSDDEKLVIDEGAATQQPFEDNVVEENSGKLEKNIELGINRYLVTNVSGLGYISAYQDETTKCVDVMCPITKKMKQFNTPQAAIEGLERVFLNKFIRYPASFKIEFTMLDNLEDTTNNIPLDRSLLHGYHVVGPFGVRNLLECTTAELASYGLDKMQITRVWALLERKLLWTPLCQLGKLLGVQVRENEMEATLSSILDKTTEEIKMLQKDNASFIKQIIDLESRKVMLVEKCSKLLYKLPANQKTIAQQELDRIVNFKTAPSPIVQEEDNDNVDNKDTSPNTISVTAPTKFTLRKGPLPKSTSLLSGKQVEIPTRLNQRSILTSPYKASLQSDKRVVWLQGKKDSSGSFVPTSSSVDLSSYTLQIKPSTEEKMLVKKIPIKVSKDILKVANGPPVPVKPLLLHSGNVGKLRNFSMHTAINIPANMKAPASLVKHQRVCKTLTPISISNASSSNTNVSSINTNYPKVTNVASVSGVPTTCVPVSLVPSSIKSVGSSIKSSSMATLTPLAVEPEYVLTNSTAKSTPNYIAIKEGNSVKYFQLISQTKSPPLISVQALKRPSSSIMVQPPLKRIAPAPSTSLLTNQKTDK